VSAPWDALSTFLIDTERLKLVERSAWVSDRSRHENTAEHSWHLTLGLLALARELKLPFDLEKALRIDLAALPAATAGDSRRAPDTAGKTAAARLARGRAARTNATTTGRAPARTSDTLVDPFARP